MKSKLHTKKTINILLIGNNPLEMGKVLEKLQQQRTPCAAIEIAFDLKSINQRLQHFTPHYILIDDNIGRQALNDTIKILTDNLKTREIPVTVLKNSNYEESLASSGILDYVLKQNLSTSSLYYALKNTSRLRKTQLYLFEAYRKKKNLFSLLKPKIKFGLPVQIPS